MWSDIIKHIWLQETILYHQKKKKDCIFFFFPEKKKEKIRPSKQSSHSKKQSSFVFTRILFIPKSNCFSPLSEMH